MGRRDNSSKVTPRYKRGDRVIIPHSGGQVGTVSTRHYRHECWCYKVRSAEGLAGVSHPEYALKDPS